MSDELLNADNIDDFILPPDFNVNETISGDINDSIIVPENNNISSSLSESPTPVITEASTIHVQPEVPSSSSITPTAANITSKSNVSPPIVFVRDELEAEVAYLKGELMEMQQMLYDIRKNQLSEKLQLSPDIIENVLDKPNIRRVHRGRIGFHLLQKEIEEAQARCDSAMSQARYLRVSYSTYKKYTKIYGIHKTRRDYKRSGRFYNPDKGKYPISRILNGDFPDFPVFRIKDKLINSGIKKAECEQCGYKERRITDNKIPLLLVFQDGNEKNHKLDNLKILCYNCTFCNGGTRITKGRKYNLLDDPDRAQGCFRKRPNRFL